MVMAGAALVLSPSGNESPGALDNGTGLAVLLALASKTPPDVAFLVTDAEELGLAGARAVARELPEVAGIINLDGLDDEGPVRIAERRQGMNRGPTGALATTLVRVGRELGLDVVRRPLPPFILLDHEPLAAAGRPALTVVKGRWHSLLRVHTPADTADRLTGIGAARVATLILAALSGPSGADHDTLRPDDGSGHSPRL
jgi:Zn-dependent M28 family amino/carboxypeptidase